MNIKMLSVAIAATLLAACSSTPQEQHAKQQEKVEKAQEKLAVARVDAMPDWFINYKAKDENGIYAVATSYADDPQVALDDARTLALTEIASKSADHLSAQKALSQKKGTGGSTTNSSNLTTDEFVVSKNMAGYEIVKREVKAEGKFIRAYVMVYFPNASSATVDTGSLDADHKALVQRVEKELAKTQPPAMQVYDLTPTQNAE